MTPEPDKQPKPHLHQGLRFFRLNRTTITLSALILLSGLAGGAWWLRNFVYKELAPLVEKNLTQTLNRPVQLGQVKRFSLTSLSFGSSSVPATATDPDWATVEAVDVIFNPVSLIFNRTLKLDVTLVNPDVYIEQDKQRLWVSTTLAVEDQAGVIKTDLDTIRVRDADVVLVPYRERGRKQKTPRLASVAIAQLNGFSQFLEDNQLIRFDGAGTMVTGGRIAIEGESRPKTQQTNLQVRGQNVLASDITRLVELPLELQAGRVDGNLKIELRQEQDAALFGTAGVYAVTAKVAQLPQAFNNTRGILSFQGTRIGLENVQTNYGKIPAIANGSLDTDAGYNLSARVPAVSVANARDTLELKLPVPVTGEVRADVKLAGPILKPTLSGTVVSTKPVRIDRVNFSNIRSRFEFAVANSVIAFKSIQATPTVGGQITGAGRIKLGETPGLAFDAVARNISGDAIARLYGGAAPQIKIGTVSATANISGTSTNPRTVVSWQAPQATYPAQGNIVISGTSNLLFRNTVASVAGGTVQGNGQLVDGRWQASLQASGVQLSRLAEVPPALQTPLSGTLNLSGTTGSFDLENISASGQGRLNVGGGTVTASSIQLADGRWQASLQATGVQLGRLAEVPPALQAPLSGTFNLSGTTDSFDLENINASGQGRLNVGGGTVTASNVDLNQGQWRAQLQATGVALERLAQGIAPQLQGRLTGIFNLSGTTASFQPETIIGTGQGRLNIAGGTVTATNIQLAKGRWRALVNASQVELARFSEQLRGRFSSQLQVAGTLDSFNLADIRAAGNVRFSQGIALVNQPLTAVIGWDGEKIAVQRATAPGLNASGVIFAKVEGAGAPEITGLNLNVQAQNYNLQDLPVALPNAVDVAGRADFAGQISGTLPTPNVTGDLRLRDFVVNNLAFEPILTGDVQVVAGGGVELELIGSRDRIAFSLNSNYRPSSFLVKRDQAIASGQTQGENLLVNVENFPLTALNLTPPNPAFGPGPVAGELTGDFQINQNTYAAAGNVAIANPAIGRLKGDSFVGQFRYADGAATLTGGEFLLGESRYALAGSFAQTPNGPQFQGQLNISQGKVQDVLTALQFFEVQDFGRGLTPANYARANVLNTVPVGLQEADLLTQLRRFSEIQALLEQQQQQRRDASPLPALADLQGTFNGEIALNGSLQTGVEVNFALSGENWEWGNFTANEIIAQGSFENGVLTLLPLRIESEETLLAFSGQVGGTQQSGQLQVRNFPVEVLDNFVNLPGDITGNLNATATLAGGSENPQAVGELQLEGGTLNQKSIEEASASFSYTNARLAFSSNVVAAPASLDPIQISGSVPFQLPFATVPPASDEISLDVNVQNEGLALLNLFTNQVAWQSGQGNVQLQVRGTRQQPVATGIATVNNATITAQALPEPLTDVTGTARFNFDRIELENLQGNFSQGNVVAQGVIPIFANLKPDDLDFSNPLTVTLNQLALNLKGLYQGGASGNVVITGSALNPVIGGEVLLANGEVLLAEQNATTRLSAASDSGVNANSTGGGAEASNGPVPEFDELRLTLGDDIAITRPPILDFRATGTLTLNGSLNDIRPDGTIQLLRGGVNLFTTQFVLARGYEHTAAFSPNQGLDPTLDIRLIAAVPEVTRSRVPTNPLSSEIAETLSTDLGGLDTVRVQARVQGPASQLFDNLELTSNPARSETEIIALLGGGFVETLGRGDSTLALANLAGSALLGNFQGTVSRIGNAIGLSELRLSPTVITSDRERSSSSTLGLAAEAGVDISNDISVSVIRILTANQPTQFGVNYRINEQFRVRASSDFSDESLAVIEYESRF